MSTLRDLQQNYALISGVVTPGKFKAQGGNLHTRWNEMQGWGLSGASLMLGGMDLGTFDGLFTLWTDEDIAAWDAFAPKYLRKPKFKPSAGGVFLPSIAALSISHPLINRLGIVSIVVEDEGQLDPQDDGSFLVTVKFKEYRAPIILGGKADQTVPKANGQDTARDAIDIEIDSKAAELNRLGEVNARLDGNGT